MPRGEAGTKFKLQPADPFDLIRWLARTQSDPRKAVAELVQNSIDANARTIRIDRRRLRGAPALVIYDDGEGVLPHRPREDALRYLGTHIGHSHKLGLSATERHARVIAGQYGVGLLGFWAIGARLDVRSRVGGSEVHVLSLEEERATARLSRIPHALDAAPTYTELVIFDLHEASQRPLSGRRLADYLAAELRGPILQTGVAIEIHDHMARGLAQKRFAVTPRRFDGVRLEVPAEIPVERHPAIRVELYLSRGAERPAIQLACAGTLVAENLADVDVLGFGEPPWVGRDLTGIIDFPGFQVPPGTRRGVVPNAAAVAFAHALARVEGAVSRELDRLDQQRRAAADRHLVDDLRKALRGLRQRMPHYELPAVDRGHEGRGDMPPGKPLPPPESATPEDDLPPSSAKPQADLFPPGPLARIEIAPSLVRIEPGHERRVRVRAFDARDVELVEGLGIQWTVEEAGFTLIGADGPRPAIAVTGDVLPGSMATLTVEVQAGGVTMRASANVAVVEARGAETAGLGIPRPELVDAPGATWRSRMAGEVWQVNAGHEDYVALGSSRARLRYMVALLGKEIVARTYSQPGAGELLEHLVAVMAHAERNLTN
ncbi:MAG TPA: ATP-binding protein [Kofleriaceae bacterium]